MGTTVGACASVHSSVVNSSINERFVQFRADQIAQPLPRLSFVPNARQVIALYPTTPLPSVAMVGR